MRRSWFPKPYADFVARLRVPGGFALVALFVWLSSPDPKSLVTGLPISILGLLLRGWAAGHLEKNRQLATSGPYAHLRNPLYAGTLLVAAGLVIAAREPLLAVIFATVFGLIYLPVIELEEQHLRELFPAYEAYAENVPILWPSLRPYATEAPGSAEAASVKRFRWRLYGKNQEYQALLGFLAGVAVLAWKAF